MTRFVKLGMGLMMLPLCSACDAVFAIVRPQTMTVRLVNNSDFAVQVDVYIDDDEESGVSESVLTELGSKLEFTIAAGDTARFARNCDDLKAIVVSDAELMIVGEIGPEADSRVFQDGDDFDCGDIITFTFDHSDLIVDFRVDESVSR